MLDFFINFWYNIYIKGGDNVVDITQAIKEHHTKVKMLGYETVMTVLIGSQNYGLDNENSDIDTFTFIFPTMEDIAFAREPVSGEFEVEDGKCMYKDIRLALNLLKKTSPNSIECFVGQYRYFEPTYETVLKRYLENEDRLNKMTHCNYSHMLYAIAGMAHQLTKRNMPAGKRFSHALRLCSMTDVFTDSLEARNLLTLLPRDYKDAKTAKYDEGRDEYYNNECVKIAEHLDEKRDNFLVSEFKKKIEAEGMALIEQFQKELMHYYLYEKE